MQVYQFYNDYLQRHIIHHIVIDTTSRSILKSYDDIAVVIDYDSKKLTVKEVMTPTTYKHSLQFARQKLGYVDADFNCKSWKTIRR